MTPEEIERIQNKAEHIQRDDSILSIPNDKYVERHLFFYEETGLHYVTYSVYDNYKDYCYYTEGHSFDILWKAEHYYDSILKDVNGKVFIYG